MLIGVYDIRLTRKFRPGQACMTYADSDDRRVDSETTQTVVLKMINEEPLTGVDNQETRAEPSEIFQPLLSMVVESRTLKDSAISRRSDH